MHWTNTCCSHPLYVPEEMEAENQIGMPLLQRQAVEISFRIKGAKRAAQRKLLVELGIPAEQIPLDDFKVKYSLSHSDFFF